ncbi:caspase family protein [Actinomadura napierensis]|uniref:Peptidase C14 caspase domain-containing protein n=1 Tax=Actinomadura napierensis TaxID=267854 RepID=A0ABN3AGF4_9ACTN
MSRFPDPARSRAVLIGVSHFPESSDLADLPAVRENVAGLWHRLTHDTTGVLDPEHCQVVDPAASITELGRTIAKAAAEASDMLLVYYAGHGLVDERGRLYLATNATRTDAPKYSALGVDLLREDIGGSGAAARVLVLDCCFSGRAIEVMTGEEGLVDGQLSIAGTYTMTSTSANAPSYALSGERYTAFTGALLAALDSPQPLNLNEIYRSVAAALQARGLPRPRMRGTDTAGALALARGGTAPPDTPPANALDEVRFRRDPAAWAEQLKSNTEKPREIFFCSVGGGLAVFFALQFHNANWLWAILPFWAVLSAFGEFVTGLAVRSLPEAELVIDRSAITVHVRQHGASPSTAQAPWRDISYVGVLPPKRGSVNPRRAQVYEGNHLLVVRLQPGVPFPATQGMRFSRELHDLGYRVIATIGSFGADKEQVLAALDRFAGERVLHTKQEFLDRDPRVQPEML